MATTKTQRIGIWIIAVFMAVGTIGSFAIIVLANSNSQNDQARYNELLAEYQEDIAQRNTDNQEKVTKYKDRVSSFDAAGVTELKKEDLEEGTGDELTSSSSFTAYYIGWNPSGVIFDSSINEDGTLKDPFTASPGMVIEGWTEGVDGMKVGGVRELTIPSEKAYGETGQGEDIPANTPLKFVIVTVPDVPVSDELNSLYMRLYANQ